MKAMEPPKIKNELRRWWKLPELRWLTVASLLSVSLGYLAPADRSHRARVRITGCGERARFSRCRRCLPLDPRPERARFSRSGTRARRPCGGRGLRFSTPRPVASITGRPSGGCLRPDASGSRCADHLLRHGDAGLVEIRIWKSCSCRKRSRRVRRIAVPSVCAFTP